MDDRALDPATCPDDPHALFAAWLAAAGADAADTAFALATATADGAPSARMVLLRGVDARGLAFFTNYASRKGRELAANPRAAALFHWPEPHRQVRIEGAVERLTAAESDAYFAARPPGSRISALASPQSEPVADRATLEARVEMLAQRYAHDPEAIPRPEHWGGFRLVPASWEFWQARAHRLHDRVRYVPEAGAWRRERLAP